MMVVMVVSRRDGQVTLAVSLRTSCRNLNGLKAIVCYRVRRCQSLRDFQESKQPSCAQPSFEGEPPSGLDCPGMSKPRRRSEKRAGSRCRYVLWSRGKVKEHRLRQNQDARIGGKRKPASVEGLEVHG